MHEHYSNNIHPLLGKFSVLQCCNCLSDLTNSMASLLSFLH